MGCVVHDYGCSKNRPRLCKERDAVSKLYVDIDQVSVFSLEKEYAKKKTKASAALLLPPTGTT